MLKHIVTCIDGQRRVQAAKSILGEDAFWTLRLPNRPGASLIMLVRNSTTSQLSNRRSCQKLTQTAGSFTIFVNSGGRAISRRPEVEWNGSVYRRESIER
ncbi:hypothetical protein CSOJ01_14625 [Colletotrichum sojae]|uniref:Uncharacterized protein n=1 Tax=Colletotrichum sojae TaxID=2175907 RepID=A0A8H6MJ45_9PEZI|nr:hypothetical protein CSOJ01_14625 [Colletotrichum sojae]